MAKKKPLRGPTARAIALVRTLHCKPPTFKPESQTPVSGHIACPKCKSRLATIERVS